MRLFPGDTIPGLGLPLQALPVPWVLPSYMSRSHRDRLVVLLWRALAKFEPELRLVQVRWAERILMEQRRLRLPASVLVWWRVDPEPPVEPMQVLRESGRFPGPAVYDLEQPADIPAFGWMGALKMEVLHRLVDVLLDERLVPGEEELTRVLGEAASLIISPIELLDFAEALVSSTAQPLGQLVARADAYARVLAARFDQQGGDGPADPFVRALVASVSRPELSEDDKELLKRAGLLEGEHSRLPLLDVLHEPEVLRRTLLHLVSSHSLTTPLWELAPQWFSREEGASSGPGPHRGELYMPLPGREWDEEKQAQPRQEFDSLREAQRLLEQGSVEEAARAVVRALERGKRTGAPPEEVEASAWLLMEIAARLTEPERSAALHELAAGIYEQLGEPRKAALALLEAGSSSLSAFRLEIAEAHFQRAIRLVESQQDEPLLARCLTGLGDARRWNNFPGAQDAYQRALALYNKSGDLLQAARTTLLLGELEQRKGDLAIASDLYEQSLKLSERSGFGLGVAYALTALGELRTRQGNLAGANDLYEQSLRLSREVGGQAIEAHTLMYLGNLRMRQDDLASASDSFMQALRLYRELGDRSGEANILTCLGDLRLRQDDLAGARDMYAQALRLYQELGLRVGESNCLRASGRVLFLLGRSDGQQKLAESIELARSIPDAHGQWLSEVMEAAYRLTKEPLKVLEVWTEAQRFFEQASYRYDAGLTQALVQLARGEEAARVVSTLAATTGRPPETWMRPETPPDRETLLRAIISLFPIA